MEQQWHNLQGDEALQTLGSRHSGLSETEAEARLLQYGANELKGKKKAPTVLVFLRQFLSPLIYVLIAAVVISFVVQHYIDALVILGVLLRVVFMAIMMGVGIFLVFNWAQQRVSLEEARTIVFAS